MYMTFFYQLFWNVQLERSSVITLKDEHIAAFKSASLHHGKIEWKLIFGYFCCFHYHYTIYIQNCTGRGFKSHSGKLSIATSKNPWVMNTICINSFCYTHVITSTKIQWKQTWWLTKAIAEMKCDTEQTMKLE